MTDDPAGLVTAAIFAAIAIALAIQLIAHRGD